MQVDVKLFAGLAQRAGRRTVTIDLAEPATVADVKTALQEMFGSAFPSSAVLALNAAYVEPAARISQGDVLAVIPPVSGGCP